MTFVSLNYCLVSTMLPSCYSPQEQTDFLSDYDATSVESVEGQDGLEPEVSVFNTPSPPDLYATGEAAREDTDETSHAHTSDPESNLPLQNIHQHSQFRSGYDLQETGEGVLEMSSTFNFNTDLDPILPDTFILTADNIFFAVHSHRLRAASIGDFGGLLPFLDDANSRMSPISRAVPEQSSVLNVVLCAAYGMSSNGFDPSLDCIAEAVQAMKRYGMLPLQRFMAKSTPLYDTILTRAPVQPIEAYALVCAENLEELAVACSSYTLHLKLHLIPMEMVVQMGAIYLHRLHNLQAMRMSSLKDMLSLPIYPHVAKPYCSAEQRQLVNRAYGLGAAQVYYSATPALSGGSIQSTMDDLIKHSKCPDCKQSLTTHVRALVTKWMLLERTI